MAAAETRRLLGESSRPPGAAAMLTCNRAAHGRAAHVWLRPARAATCYYRPQGVPLIPGRQLPPRPVHQHQERAGSVSQVAQRGPQDRVPGGRRRPEAQVGL
jgi:hypothetical protein